MENLKHLLPGSPGVLQPALVLLTPVPQPLTANAQERLFYERESKAAFANGTQTADITAEQRKLLWADAVIPFRRQNSGHYDTQQVLLPGLGDGASGTRIHLVQQGDPEQRPVTPSGGSPA
ncbi:MULTISPECIES: hypothetical protein [Corallococcus]|uniref:hypothetical protein n=1 Tax=Corallococcus TaxID=83461 RepID=UPI0018F3CF59|nr:MULTISPECIES: hypothetical protein [Corallococcus]